MFLLFRSIYSNFGAKFASGIYIGMQQCHMGDRRNCRAIRRRHEAIRTSFFAIFDRNYQSGKDSENIVRKYRYVTFIFVYT